MATTTNFGWTTPDDTALVKDGASAIRTLGSSIDTSMADLKGGTTGQILSKTSNTDMAFTWINNDQGDITAVTAGTGLTGGGTTGAVTLALDSTAVISPTIVDAKGDIIAATAADTVARLAVGTNGQYLSADSTTATGLKWATVSAPTQDFTLINSGGTSLTGSSVTINVSGKNQIFIFISGASVSGTTGADFFVRLNGDTGNNYTVRGLGYNSSFTWSTEDLTDYSNFYLGYTTTNGGTLGGTLFISGANATGIKTCNYFVTGSSQGSARIGQGFYKGTSAITSVTIAAAGNNFDAGTVWVYGA